MRLIYELNGIFCGFQKKGTKFKLSYTSNKFFQIFFVFFPTRINFEITRVSNRKKTTKLNE